MRVVRVLPATLFVLCAFAGPAVAADVGRSVSAIGTGSIPIAKTVAQNDAAIRAAVVAARAKAVPAAVEAAKAEAQMLASATGMTLGSLISVSELQLNPFVPFFVYGIDGTFGAGKYCGTIHTQVFKRVKGVRKRVGSKSHHGCRVPAAATFSVMATFSAT